MLLSLYKGISTAALPLYYAAALYRSQIGKEDKQRLAERYGKTDKKRSDTDHVWIHAASVGESQSILKFILHISQKHPEKTILVTTGTVTSANFIAPKLPANALHQFIPMDQPQWVKRFLTFWKPQCGIFIESEIWPNLLTECKERGIPLTLLNARMSEQSFKNWQKIHQMIKEVLAAFSLVLTQTPANTEYYKKLGAKNVHTLGNIKYAADPLPIKDEILSEFQKALSRRTSWVYASTHKGEETLACRIQAELKKDIPNLLTIVIPRHPNRKQEILDACKPYNLNIACRSEAQPLEENTDIYLADTMGELGLFYRAAPVACIGRSLSDDGGGGHNPLEPAHFQTAILSGKNIQYQTELFDALKEYDAVDIVEDGDGLMAAVKKLLTDPAYLKTMQENAYSFIQKQDQIWDQVLHYLEPFISEQKINEAT